MQFRVASYRHGLQILRACGALGEISQVLGSITLDEVQARRESRQKAADERAEQAGKAPRRAGVQAGLNALLSERFGGTLGWLEQVPVFAKDPDSDKGFWTLDFVKPFAEEIRVGVEVTFNHGEAIPWTLIRPTLAHESEGVLPAAQIHVGVVISGTDHLKGNRKTGLRMDSAVGTYERLRTLLPKMRAVLPAPLVLFGLDWQEGGQKGDPEEISLHTSLSGLSADDRI